MWYLCAFYHRLLDYRKPEVESLAHLFGAHHLNGDVSSSHLQWKLPLYHHPDSPFHFVNLPSEHVARNIAKRSILVKGMYELWGEGGSYEELRDSVLSNLDDRKLTYLESGTTFKITVDSFGKAISLKEQKELIQGFSYIPFKGQVKLKNPDHNFWLIVVDNNNDGANNGLPPIVQKRMFFGREVGAADRSLIPTYQLKNRTYLGPTAMDAEMAFLMANQALATPGKLIYDPFVGTGSILVAAAHFGAMTMGADIDIRVVRDGRGPDCNVWSNFKQYGLPMPVALLRADNNLPPWRPGLKEVMARYIACIEIRPLPSGVWIYEDHRAVYEGVVELTFYHPNPLVWFHPRRFRIPIIYTMHVPPFYTYHGPHPTRPVRSYHSFRFRPVRSHPFSPRVVREETPSPDPTSPIRVTPTPDLVPSGRVPTPSGEIEEDLVEDESGGEPVEHSIGSQWRDDDP